MKIGDKVIKDWRYSFCKVGTIVGIEGDNYVIQFEDGKTESMERDGFISYTEPIKPKKDGTMSKAYKIWAIGMTLSLLGLLGGQWLGEIYKEPLVYYIVSGIWATLIGGSSAVIGLIILSKSEIK